MELRSLVPHNTHRCEEKFPENYTVTYEKVQDLRYGENPHQEAAFYKSYNPKYSLANAKQLHGKELSYNNIQDANASSSYEGAIIISKKI